ncbi:MAG TPA: MBL fold metallo-hydrolase [Nitrososphaerales archaeon]|nr:MBL fold metallo-hydrolase [Nitrososphaerales archaeon]
MDDSVFGGYGANQGFVILEDSVLAFDSGFSLPQARHLEASIRSVTDKKIRFLINSHDHSDHIFGNSFFMKKYSSHGLSIISHSICSENISRQGPRRLKNYLKIPGLKKLLLTLDIEPPNITYPDLGFRIELGGTEIVLAHPPTGAHTLGDTALYLPKKGVVYFGDIVWNRFLPNLEDANLEGWISFLEEIDLDTYKKCIPGHGDVCGPTEIINFQEYLKSVRKNLLEFETRNLLNNRNSLRSCFEVPGTEDWKLRSIIEYNIDALFGKDSYVQKHGQ